MSSYVSHVALSLWYNANNVSVFLIVLNYCLRNFFICNNVCNWRAWQFKFKLACANLNLNYALQFNFEFILLCRIFLI